MPKAERGTPKDIGIRIKAKGLQKLKFYCQMCQKQCRDANGFKCHLTSDNHLRQMKIFSDNAGGILDSYSKEFERTYIATLKMRHGTKLVNANNVYQEVIQDKQHIHMNATHWTTLTEFVQYLGKTGKCAVEETERGWYVSYIERDASILARQEALKRREEGEKAAEEAQAQRMELQRLEAIKALDKAGGTVHMEATKLDRTNSEEPIKVALGGATSLSSMSKKPETGTNATKLAFGDDDDDEEDEEEEEPILKAPKLALPPKMDSLKRKEAPNTSSKRTASNTDNKPLKRSKITKDGDKDNKDKKKQHNDAWLYRNILVRIISKSFANGKYFKQKAIVDKVLDDYTARVEVLEENKNNDTTTTIGGDILQLDQEDLETVIPKKEGSKVRILLGKYRGEKAIVEYLDKKGQQADLRLCYNDKLLKRVPYEEFAKIA